MSLCSRPLLKTKILIRFYNWVGFWLKLKSDRNNRFPLSQLSPHFTIATTPPPPQTNQTLAWPAASHPFPISTPSLLLELKIISCRICSTFQKLLVLIQQHTAILELEAYSSNNLDNTYTERDISLKVFVNNHLFHFIYFCFITSFVYNTYSELYSLKIITKGLWKAMGRSFKRIKKFGKFTQCRLRYDT